MNIGKRIKEMRQAAGLTQAGLCGDRITRNMLSAIENGTATPSIETLTYLANALSAPISYFLSEDTEIGIYKKNHAIDKIRAYFKKGSYAACIALIERIGTVDDELALLLAECHFELGKKAVYGGSLITAMKHFENAEKYKEMTLYPTERIGLLLPLYRALAANIQAPMLEIDPSEYLSAAEKNTENEFFRYISMQWDYDYKDPLFALHAKAKSLMRMRRYRDAVAALIEIENMKSTVGYNAHVMLGVYTDLEICHRELGDFERAYRYANKRISLLEGFKS